MTRPKPQGFTPVKTAGKTVAQRNADRLNRALSAILEILIDAGMADPQALDTLLKQKPSEDADEPVAAAASGSLFKDAVSRSTWGDRLRSILDIFAAQLQNVLSLPEADLSKVGVTDGNRQDGIETLLSDLDDLLKNLTVEHPGPTANHYGHHYHESYFASKEEPVADAGTPVSAVATDFKATVERVTWRKRLEDTLRIFSYRFRDLQDSPDDQLKQLGVDDRAEAITGILQDLQDLLNSLIPEHPETGSNPYPTSPDVFDVFCSAAAAEGETVHEIRLQAPASLCLQADDDADEIDLNTINRRPIEGVIFRVDEPSEAVPSVGPGLPLYIPRAVAETALASVCGLPLDADDSLTCHADSEIAGVMLEGEIKGNDCIIRGLLWPWSQNKKVTAISLAKEQLGMSMNGFIAGHEVKMDGRQVYYIDQLILVGANILYAERATYKKTRILAAQTATPFAASAPQVLSATATQTALTLAIPVVAEPLAASAAEVAADPGVQSEPSLPVAPLAVSTDESVLPTNTPGEEPDMALDPELKAQLDGITVGLAGLSNLADAVTSLNASVGNLNTRFDGLQAEVAVIQTDRTTALETLAATQAAEAERQQQNNLKTLIQTTFAEMVNPSGQPARITTPLAAQSAATTTVDGKEKTRSSLIAAEARLSELQSRPMGDGTREVALKEEIRSLKAALGA